jgi:hypothetical protein
MASIGAELKLLVLSVAAGASAFAMRRIFLSDIVPVAWADEPQAPWAVIAAFLLRAVENIAAVVAVVAIIMLAARWIGRVPARSRDATGITPR